MSSSEIQRQHTDFYVVTLHASKKNSSLLDPTGHLRVDARRNIDYDIISSSVWKDRKNEYDTEIPVKNAYNVRISFMGNEDTTKEVCVHGVEKVFDVVRTLFVCRAWSVEQFNRMYEIRRKYEVDGSSRFEAIDSMMNFEQLGDPSEKIELSIERQASLMDEVLQVMETSTVDEHEMCSINTQRCHSQGRHAFELIDACAMISNNMRFYETIYTLIDKRKDDISHVYQALYSAGETNSSAAMLKCLKNQECIGIMNIGNSCYMNSSIQCLNRCTVFSNFFYCFSKVFHSSGCAFGESNFGGGRPPFIELDGSKTFRKKQPIIAAWCEVVRQTREPNLFTPKSLKQEIASKSDQFNNVKEQDAAEFIETLLGHLHDGLCYRAALDSESSPSEDQGESMSESISEIERSSRSSDSPDPGSTSNGFSDANMAAISAEYKRLIGLERSIITELFYGMTTTRMECKTCAFKKFRNELLMLLPLSIPNKTSYHSSCTLMLLGDKVLVKALIPLNFTVQEAIEYTKVECNSTSNFLALEYCDGCLVQVLPGHKNINSVKNSIFFYEMKPNKTYVVCNLYYTRLYFMKYKIPIDFLVEEDSYKHDLYNKLKHYFLKNFTLREFLAQISIKLGSHNKILNMATVDVVFSNTSTLFGDRLSHLTVQPPRKKNDVSLRDCLEFYSREESIEVFCENCERFREFAVSTALTKHPKYLMIHLKRFNFFKGGAKVNTFIEFPEDNMRIGSTRYKLVATSNHIEIGLGCGHYVAYLRKDSGWFCCNDSVISRVPGPDKASSYILFYEKIA